MVVLLGGAPGVGKSAVAGALSGALVSGAVVEVDALWGMHARADYSNGEQFTRALRMAAALVLLLPGPAVLVSPWSVAALDAFAAMVPERPALISLVADEMTLRERLGGRPAWAFHDVAASVRLNEEHLSHPSPRVQTVGRTVDEIAGEVLGLILR